MASTALRKPSQFWALRLPKPRVLCSTVIQSSAVGPKMRTMCVTPRRSRRVLEARSLPNFIRNITGCTAMQPKPLTCDHIKGALCAGQLPGISTFGSCRIRAITAVPNRPNTSVIQIGETAWRRGSSLSMLLADVIAMAAMTC